jgi:2-C-methyl-D-erythritol 4-phosphate cytidylyltransferase
MSQWQELYKESYSHIQHRIVKGGEERFHSVLNALNTVPDQPGLVAIHDAARPFVSHRLINDAFYQAEINGSAVPALRIKDTIRAYSLGQWVPADRDTYRTIQTPQVFDIPGLKKAYLQHYSPQFTDDATVWESAGKPVHLVDGDEQNFKITTPLDMEFAQYLSEKERISRK